MSGATQDIADFVVRRRPGSSPNAEAVGRALVDTVAVAVAGFAEEGTRMLLDWLSTEHTEGPARVWGTSYLFGPSQAALVNGAAAHALDWDDAVPSMPIHPSAVLFPAMLAMLPTVPAYGDDFVHAYEVGTAVFRAVSDVLPIDVSYARGWHNTSTSGRLGAVAALSYLCGLDERQVRHALGIVASSAAGSLANFGSMTKPLHAGEAARDAVIAVALARSGFTSHEHQLEARRGFFAMYGAPADLSALSARLEHWESDWVHDWVVKRHPSCFATHRGIDAALRLSVEPEAVTEVKVSFDRDWVHTIGEGVRPATGLEGKFNIDYAVARAIVTGVPTLRDFTDEAVEDREVLRLMRVLSYERHDPGTGPHTRVEVTLADGTVTSAGATVTYGDARDPLSQADLDAKFTAAFSWAGWSEDRAAALLARLKTVPTAADLGWLQEALA